MASLIEELISTLEQESRIYEELIPIAEEKTLIIVKNDLQSLQKIIDKEQLAIDKINALEKKREEVTANIAVVINKDVKTLKVTDIILMLEKQVKEQEKLSEVHKNLKSTLLRLVDINNHNKSLINESLEMIEFNMNFIQSTRMSPGNNNYGKGAASIGGEPYQTGMFDTRK